MGTATMSRENDYITALRALACIAQSEGVLTKSERSALQAAWHDLPASPSASLDEIVFESRELSDCLNEVRSEEAKETLYRSACLMLRRDGQASPDKEALLKRLRDELKIEDPEASFTQRVKEYAEKLVAEARDTILPNRLEAIADVTERKEKSDTLVLKYGVLTAAIGTFPVPASDLVLSAATVALQVKMFHDIGLLYGVRASDEQIKEVLAGVGAGTTVRIVLVTLMKFIPLWGSIVGAATGFATTWALGKVAQRYYESGQAADPKILREVFLEAQQEGKDIYTRNKHRLDERLRAQKEWLRGFFNKAEHKSGE